MSRIEAARKAVSEAGSAAKLADALLPEDRSDEEWNRMHWRIMKWMQAGVPPHYVLRVEQVTGVSRHDLHPEVFPNEAA